jgi:hypothetical protein
MKYDSAHIDPLIKSLEDGEGRVRACKIANIDYQTLLNWIDDKVEFLELVKKAEAKGNDRIKDLQKRKIIEDKSWQSGAWWLERNFPDEFKNRSEIKHDSTLEDARKYLAEKLTSNEKQSGD